MGCANGIERAVIERTHPLEEETTGICDLNPSDISEGHCAAMGACASSIERPEIESTDPGEEETPRIWDLNPSDISDGQLGAMAVPIAPSSALPRLGAIQEAVFRTGCFQDSYTESFALHRGTYTTVYTAVCGGVSGHVRGWKAPTMVAKVTQIRAVDMEERLDEAHLIAIKKVMTDVASLQLLKGQRNIPRIHDAFLTTEFSYVVCESCECSLWEHFKARLRNMTENLRKSALADMLRGINTCHAAGVVHRDVKPGNFQCFVERGPSGEQEVVVKLCDFGHASANRPEGLKGVEGGMVSFMAPEMLLGRRYSTGVDVWAFGAIAYTFLFGEYPYKPAQKKPGCQEGGYPQWHACARIRSGTGTLEGGQALR